MPQGTKICSFFPSHEPLPDNYAHSEILAFRSGNAIPSNSLGKMARKEFRAIMSDKGFLLRPPKT